MPLLALLLLKLQGWVHHRDSHRRDYQEKQHVDVVDIEELLDIALDAGIVLDTERWMPEVFVLTARQRVEEFTAEFPETSYQWATIGF